MFFFSTTQVVCFRGVLVNTYFLYIFSDILISMGIPYTLTSWEAACGPAPFNLVLDYDMFYLKQVLHGIFY